MDLLCMKCRHLVETEKCPVCGSTDTRPPEAADPCFLVAVDGPRSALLAGTLERENIPFRMLTTRAGKIKMYRAFFVPFERIDDAITVTENLWKDGDPVSAELFELSSELFAGDEIDNMEASQLDDLSREDLQAYLEKIRKTLKEIRLEEQRWKQRTNRLLDMKEEAEALLEDL